MEELIGQIYQDIQELGYIQNGRKEGERMVKSLSLQLQNIKDLNCDKITDEMYGLMALSEKNGFIWGFRYAVNLMMECKM